LRRFKLRCRCCTESAKVEQGEKEQRPGEANGDRQQGEQREQSEDNLGKGILLPDYTGKESILLHDPG